MSSILRLTSVTTTTNMCPAISGHGGAMASVFLRNQSNLIKKSLKSYSTTASAVAPSVYKTEEPVEIFNQKSEIKGQHDAQTVVKIKDVSVNNTLVTEPTWPHPIYTKEQMESISVAHRDAKTISDKLALATITLLRRSFDLFTGYRHPKNSQEANMKKFQMTEKKWLTRFLFLESIAGVPGMVGGMVRHLQSLRLLKRDKAWIETLLEEAYNERMHLLTFMQLMKPGWFMRVMLLAGQGVFCNLFFFSYLLIPKTCHRFVGYLEEEAVVTYSRCIKDIDEGKLPNWAKHPVPDKNNNNQITPVVPYISRMYWKMKPDASMRDLINYVRADEAKHREVNHTFANIKKTDRNPFVLKIDNKTPQPSKDLSTYKSTGWERDEIHLVEN